MLTQHLTEGNDKKQVIPETVLEGAIDECGMLQNCNRPMKEVNHSETKNKISDPRFATREAKVSRKGDTWERPEKSVHLQIKDHAGVSPYP